MDIELIQAYKNTTYRVLIPKIDLKVGAKHPIFDEFLIDNNVYSWAFITAYNPYSLALSKEENENKQEQLLTQVQKERYICTEGLGIGQEGDWPPEHSVLILGIELKRATDLAVLYKQNAFVFGKLNQEAELIICK